MKIKNLITLSTLVILFSTNSHAATLSTASWFGLENAEENFVSYVQRAKNFVRILTNNQIRPEEQQMLALVMIHSAKKTVFAQAQTLPVGRDTVAHFFYDRINAVSDSVRQGNPQNAKAIVVNTIKTIKGNL